MHSNLLASKLQALATAVTDVTEAVSPGSASRDAALLSLLHRPGLTVTALAALLRLSQPATTRLLQALGGEGLLHRLPSGGRSKALKLSKPGLRAAETIQKRRFEAIEACLGHLDAKKLAQLERIVSTALTGFVESPKQARALCRFCDHGLCDGKVCPVGSELRRRFPEEEA